MKRERFIGKLYLPCFIVTQSVLLIETLNLKMSCQTKKEMSNLLILGSRLVFLMIKRLRFFVGRQAIWLRKLQEDENFVDLLQIYGQALFYFSLFSAGVFLFVDKITKIFMQKFKKPTSTFQIMFLKVLKCFLHASFKQMQVRDHLPKTFTMILGSKELLCLILQMRSDHHLLLNDIVTLMLSQLTSKKRPKKG